MYIPCMYTATEIIDIGYKAKNMRFSWDKHGAAVCTYKLPNKGTDKLRYVVRQGGAMIDIMGSGGLVWRGRVSAATIEQSAVEITAHGLQDEFNHVRVFHSWVNTKTNNWVQAVDEKDVIFPFTKASQNQQFTCDNNNRLYIALTKGNIYANYATASWYLLPIHSPVAESASAPLWTRPILRIKANYEMLMPIGFEWRVVGEHETNPPNAFDVFVWNTLAGSGVRQTGSINIDVSANPRYTVRMSIMNNTGSDYTMTDETGTMYLRLTGIEIITGTGAGAVDTFEIFKNMALLVSTQRGITINASKSTVIAPPIELLHEVYNDLTAYEIMNRLSGYGDANGARCNWWIENDYSLYMRQTQVGGRTFVVKSDNSQTKYDLRTISNRYYGVYNDPNGYPMRTAWVNDTTSQRLHGVVRTAAYNAQTTSATMAGIIADNFYDTERGVRSRMIVDAIMTENGNVFPFWQLRAGDIIYDINQSTANQAGQLGADAFYLEGWEYDADNDLITLYPENELESVESMLAGG